MPFSPSLKTIFWGVIFFIRGYFNFHVFNLGEVANFTDVLVTANVIMCPSSCCSLFLFPTVLVEMTHSFLFPS